MLRTTILSFLLINANVEAKDAIAYWTNFLNTNNRKTLIANSKYNTCGCGKVYGIADSSAHGNFVIADMREIRYSEPHYHSENVTEIYIVLEGSATIVVGNEILSSKKDDIIITPPLTTHYVIPDKDCIIGCIALPYFKIEDYHPINETNLTFKFDKELFDKLTIK